MDRLLRGRLLIATPMLNDPNFAGSVVLIAEHSKDGAMGLVLNRPLNISVSEAVPLLSDFVGDDTNLYAGGPVQPDAVMALADFVDSSRAAVIAFGSVGFLPADADGTLDPATVVRARVFVGYSGFTDDPDNLWRTALRRHGGILAMFALQPIDPTLN